MKDWRRCTYVENMFMFLVNRIASMIEANGFLVIDVYKETLTYGLIFIVDIGEDEPIAISLDLDNITEVRYNYSVISQRLTECLANQFLSEVSRG